MEHPFSSSVSLKSQGKGTTAPVPPIVRRKKAATDASAQPVLSSSDLPARLTHSGSPLTSPRPLSPHSTPSTPTAIIPTTIIPTTTTTNPTTMATTMSATAPIGVPAVPVTVPRLELHGHMRRRQTDMVLPISSFGAITTPPTSTSLISPSSSLPPTPTANNNSPSSQSVRQRVKSFDLNEDRIINANSNNRDTNHSSPSHQQQLQQQQLQLQQMQQGEETPRTSDGVSEEDSSSLIDGDGDEDDDHLLDAILRPEMPEIDLSWLKLGRISLEMRCPLTGIPVHHRKIRFKTHTKCFEGKAATDWLANRYSSQGEVGDDAMNLLYKLYNLGAFYQLSNLHDTGKVLWAFAHQIPREILIPLRKNPQNNTTAPSISWHAIDLDKKGVISDGANAKVFKGTWNGREVAVKKMNYYDEILLLEGRSKKKRNQKAIQKLLENKFGSEELDIYTISQAWEEFGNEIHVLSGISHKNIIQMKGVCHKPFAMVMEWMNYGSLYDFLHAEDGIPLDWQIAIGLAKDIAYGVQYLHSWDIIHRDLKSPNVLLNIEGGTITAKLIDFGLSEFESEAGNGRSSLDVRCGLFKINEQGRIKLVSTHDSKSPRAITPLVSPTRPSDLSAEPTPRPSLTAALLQPPQHANDTLVAVAAELEQYVPKPPSGRGERPDPLLPKIYPMEEMKKEFEAVVERQIGKLLKEMKKLREEKEQDATAEAELLAKTKKKYKLAKEKVKEREKELQEKEDKNEELTSANQSLDERANLLMDLTRRQEITISKQKETIDRMTKQIKMFEKYLMDGSNLVVDSQYPPPSPSLQPRQRQQQLQLAPAMTPATPALTPSSSLEDQSVDLSTEDIAEVDLLRKQITQLKWRTRKNEKIIAFLSASLGSSRSALRVGGGMTTSPLSRSPRKYTNTFITKLSESNTEYQQQLAESLEPPEDSLEGETITTVSTTTATAEDSHIPDAPPPPPADTSEAEHTETPPTTTTTTAPTDTPTAKEEEVKQEAAAPTPETTPATPATPATGTASTTPATETTSTTPATTTDTPAAEGSSSTPAAQETTATPPPPPTTGEETTQATSTAGATATPNTTNTNAQQPHAATPTDDQDKKEKLKRLIEAKKLLSSRSLHTAAAAANAATATTTSDNKQGEASPSSSSSSSSTSSEGNNNNQSAPSSSSSSNQTPMGISPSKPGRGGPFTGQASLTVARRQQVLREIAAQKKERKKDMRGSREFYLQMTMGAEIHRKGAMLDMLWQQENMLRAAATSTEAKQTTSATPATLTIPTLAPNSTADGTVAGPDLFVSPRFQPQQQPPQQHHTLPSPHHPQQHPQPLHQTLPSPHHPQQPQPQLYHTLPSPHYTQQQHQPQQYHTLPSPHHTQQQTPQPLLYSPITGAPQRPLPPLPPQPGEDRHRRSKSVHDRLEEKAEEAADATTKKPSTPTKEGGVHVEQQHLQQEIMMKTSIDAVHDYQKEDEHIQQQQHPQQQPPLMHHHLQQEDEKGDVNIYHNRQRKVANPVWLAPELIRNVNDQPRVTKKVDVYSYGVILYEIVTRQSYFGELRFMSQLEDFVVKGMRPELPERVQKEAPELAALVRECWSGDPARRPSFDEIVIRLETLKPKRLERKISFGHLPKQGEERDGSKDREKKEEREKKGTRVFSKMKNPSKIDLIEGLLSPRSRKKTSPGSGMRNV